VPKLHRSPLDALAGELGAVAGQVEREANYRLSAALADLRAHEAEREARFVRLERLVEERVASVKDGAPGKDGRDGDTVTMDDLAPLIERAVRDGIDASRAALASLPAPQDGKDGRDGVDGTSVTVDDVRPVVSETVEKAVAAIPVPKDGRDGSDGASGRDGVDGTSVSIDDIRPIVSDLVEKAVGAIPPPNNGNDGRDGVDGAPGKDGRDGKLPVVRAWFDQIHYDTDVVTHNGSLYQALRDTAKEPPHADWGCLAAAGRDGMDGRSFAIRGTHKEDGEYRALDVVVLNGASFVAKRDAPGECPGDGWQLMAAQGKRGAPGERGPIAKGERGLAGPKVSAMEVNDAGLLTLKNEDGSTVTCDLYPLLSKLGR
jgi:hypothetical protein